MQLIVLIKSIQIVRNANIKMKGPCNGRLYVRTQGKDLKKCSHVVTMSINRVG